MNDDVINELANAFLRWPLPESVCADLCVTVHKYKGVRIGTNLLTFPEAQQMMRDIVAPALAAKDAEIEKLRAESPSYIAQMIEEERDQFRAEKASLRRVLSRIQHESGDQFACEMAKAALK